MKLRETEALGVEDDHHGGVGHVDAYLDDGGSDENLGLTADEALHLFFLVFQLHAAMHLAETEFREGLFQYLETVFKILEVALGTLFYQGEYDIYLTARADLLTDAVVE